MSVDDLIADVVHLVEGELGLAEHTYFVYTSDHGFQLGQFNILMVQPNAPMPQCPIAPMPHCPNAPMPQCTNAPMHQCTNAPMHQCTNAPMHQCTNAPMPRCTNAPMHHCTNAPLPQCPDAPMPQCISKCPMHQRRADACGCGEREPRGAGVALLGAAADGARAVGRPAGGVWVGLGLGLGY